MIGLGLAMTSACAGKAPKGDDGVTVDAPAPGIDAPPADLGQTVTGRAMDYFTVTPLPDTVVATDGIDPMMTSTATAAGMYELDHVPTGSKLFLSATRANYKATRNTPTTVAGVEVTQDVYVASVADTNRQYTSVGLTAAGNVGKAVVFAELQLGNGTPLEGIPLTNITLLDGLAAPVTTAGIFFVGPNGDVVLPATLATATAYVFPVGTPSRSRVALLGVPAGSYTLSVVYPGPAGDLTMTVGITAVADGFELALAEAPMGGTTSPTDPHFATDIYPMLQKAANGGLGCANCHTLGGAGAVLKYDDPAATVLTNMNAIVGVINLATPATSLFLVKPLYELPPAVQDHPNATFIDINDPNYKLFLLWITNGAKP